MPVQWRGADPLPRDGAEGVKSPPMRHKPAKNRSVPTTKPPLEVAFSCPRIAAKRGNRQGDIKSIV